VQIIPQKKNISFISWIFLLLNFAAVLLLLAVYISVYINPSKFSLIAFAGLAYPVILVLNIAFVIFWIFIRIKYSLLSLLFILIGWNYIGRLVQLNSKTELPDGNISVKVLSYNIQNFVNKNISDTRYITDFKNQARITKFIIDQKADIICLQEMLYDRGDHRNFAVDFGKKCNTTNFYYRNYFQTKKKKLDAIAIFTRFPMIDKGFLEYENKTIGIYTDLLMGADTVRLYNLHLASIHFRKEDYDFISDLQNQTDQNDIKENSLKVLSKIRSAYITRGRQVKILEEHINKCPYAFIICGDFNDTPSSYVYRTLRNKTRDAFVESGSGFGVTFAGKSFPSFRIDYILHHDKFEGYNFTRHKVALSDHYPVSCILAKAED